MLVDHMFCCVLRSLYKVLALVMSGDVNVHGMDFCPDVVH